jgi:hypothetical protein
MSGFQGKVNGFHVIRSGEGAGFLRCFAMVTIPDVPTDGNEIQVFTDELPLMLALFVGATVKAQVEVAYDESDEGMKRLSSLRVLDR